MKNRCGFDMELDLNVLWDNSYMANSMNKKPNTNLTEEEKNKLESISNSIRNDKIDGIRNEMWQMITRYQLSYSEAIFLLDNMKYTVHTAHLQSIRDVQKDLNDRKEHQNCYR